MVRLKIASTLVLALLLGAATVSAGCFGLFGEDAPADASGNQGLDALGDNTIDDLGNRLSAIPRNYTFAGQLALPSKVLYINGTVGPEANAAFEDRNDRSGNSINTPRVMTDVAQYIPSGQPTEMRLTLYAAPQPGSSAEIDIVVDVPGTQTDYAGDNGDEFNWKWSVQRMVVNTIGVPGETHAIGVQIANGKLVQPMAYTLRAEFTYEKDVITPYHPWAFQVPANATGIVLESAKAGGLESIRAKFAVIGPGDELVAFVDYNDISIPTESVFVPASAGAGEYIVYVFEMTGGFLRLYSDVGSADRAARPLALDEKTEVVASGPAPGVVGRDWARGTSIEGGGGRTPASGGGTASIKTGTFPLRVVPFVSGSGPTLGTQVSVSSGSGLVAEYTRVARVDTDLGHVGYTSEFWNRMFHPENLAKDMTVTFVNDSPTLQAGYVLVTYKR